MLRRTINLTVGLLLLGLLVVLGVLFWQQGPRSVSTVERLAAVTPPIRVTTPATEQPAPPTSVTPSEEPAAAPAHPPATPTALPDRGVQLGESRRLPLKGGDADFRTFLGMSADDNTLVAVSLTNTQGLGATIIAIDLKTGIVQRLTKYGPPRTTYLYVSDQRVVWSEEISPTVPHLLTEELHVYDLNKKTEETVAQDYFQRLHYKHGIATWTGEQNNVRGIYGYNFSSGKLFLIEAAAVGHILLFSRVCSSEWVIYFLTTDYEALPATLHARNITTGEDLQIDNVTLPRSLSYMITPHDCEGENIVWLEKPADSLLQPPMTQIKFYNLATRTQQSVNLPGLIDSLKLSGNLLHTGQLDGLGYDLVRQVAFDAVSSAPADGYTPSEALFVNDQWVQLQENSERRPIIYIADVVRD